MWPTFVITNLDKEEYLDPRDFDEGGKFLESFTNTLIALSYLLQQHNDHTFAGHFPAVLPKEIELLRGTWSGDRISVAGVKDKAELYRVARKNWKRLCVGRAL